MPRTLSGNALAAIFTQHTEEAFLLLARFRHEPTDETYYAALNTENVVSNGVVHTATWFEIQFPEVGNRAPQGCQVSIDNVDLRLVGLLRTITQPLQVRLQVVLASTPDVVEMEFEDLVLREANWNVSKITGRLVSEDPLNQVYPAHLYEPRSFQGLF